MNPKPSKFMPLHMLPRSNQPKYSMNHQCHQLCDKPYDPNTYESFLVAKNQVTSKKILPTIVVTEQEEPISKVLVAMTQS